MDSYQETHNTWNKVTSAYEDSFMDLELYNDTYDLFLNLLPQKNAAILDVGCGPGNISRYLASQNSELELHGFDVSSKMIERAKVHIPSGDFRVLDVRNLKTLNQNFQGIICGFCLPYLAPKDCEDFIASCSPIIRTRGVLYLSFMEGEISHSGFVEGSTGDRVFFYYHTLESITAFIKKAHFSVAHLLYKTYTKKDGTKERHTIMIATKKE